MWSRDCWSCIALCRRWGMMHRVNTEAAQSSSDSVFAPCGLNLLLRFPLRHTSSLNYLLPFPSHFKDRCTNHEPEREAFIMCSLFKPQGFMTGWVVLTHSAPQVFFFVNLLPCIIEICSWLSGSHTHTLTVCSTASPSPPCLLWYTMQDQRHRSCIAMTSHHNVSSRFLSPLLHCSCFKAQEASGRSLQWPAACIVAALKEIERVWWMIRWKYGTDIKKEEASGTFLNRCWEIFGSRFDKMLTSAGAISAVSI